MTDTPAQPKRLSTKQELWVAAYLGDAKGNATEAARMAGYKLPEASGKDNLRNPTIYARVKEYVDEKFDVSADTVLTKLAEIAFAPSFEFVEVIGRDKSGKPVKAKMDLSNQVKALELLGKYLQLFTEKQEVNINVREHYRGVPQSTLERILTPADKRLDA